MDLSNSLLYPINSDLSDTTNSFHLGNQQYEEWLPGGDMSMLDYHCLALLAILFLVPLACCHHSSLCDIAAQSKFLVVSQMDDHFNLVLWDAREKSTVYSGWNDEMHFLLGWIAKIKCSICSVIFDKITVSLRQIIKPFLQHVVTFSLLTAHKMIIELHPSLIVSPSGHPTNNTQPTINHQPTTPNHNNPHHHHHR